MLSVALMWLSGGLLVGAALLKGIHTRPLRGVLDQLGLGRLAFWSQGVLLAAAIGVQAAAGVALMTGLWPVILPPAVLAVALLTIAVTVTKRSGRLEGCGCYGSFHAMTPAVTRVLDVLLIGSLSGLVWLGAPGGGEAVGAFTLLAGVAAAVLAGLSWWRGPMIEIGPLRAGRRWDPTWSRGVLPVDGVVVLASGQCSVCHAWVKVLTARVRLGGFFPVTLLTPGAEGEAAFADVPFPVIPIGSWAFHRLTSAVPNAVRVENGVVAEVFSGGMPAEWVAPLREARASAVPARATV